MKRWLRPGAGSLWLALLVSVSAPPTQAEGIAYVADMLQRGPQGVVSTGRLYVSGDQRRIEVSRGGESMVSIMDGSRGIAWTLFPAKKAYTEQKASVAGPQAGAPMDPCAGMPGAQCRKLGEEQVAGRMADKWEIRYQQQGMTLTSHQWIDRERRMPLRQEMPGGQRSELRFVGFEQLNGRKVEKWEMVSSQANKAPVRTLQWYDAELQQAIKQEMPGGYTSELSNIRIGALEASLFQVPADYQKLSMPAAADKAR